MYVVEVMFFAYVYCEFVINHSCCIHALFRADTNVCTDKLEFAMIGMNV